MAGVDEAGRGSLCGPVVAAAFIAEQGATLPDVRDSKMLTPSQRDKIYREILNAAKDYAIGVACPREVDELNVLGATMRAMARALRSLRIRPEIALVDGNRLPETPFPAQAVKGGDAKVGSIAAASVLAKVTRDSLMLKLHQIYPRYGWARNKGYGTPEHLKALSRWGPCPQHRLTFSSVRQPKLMI